MYYLHFLFRYSFAMLAGLFFGGLLLTACCSIGFVCLIVPNILAQLLGILFLGFGVTLFTSGLKLGFTWGSHFYKDHILGDAANPLLHKIDRLSTAKPVKLLSPNEVTQLQQMPAYKDKLDKYLNDIDDVCPISQEPFFSDTPFVTITGVTFNMQHGNQVAIPFTRTYERNSIREWLRIKGENATEPAIGCSLNDSQYKIEFHAGLPPWIYEFIQTVRPQLAVSSHATVINQINEKKETEEPLPIKAKTAQLRQEYYKKRFFNNSSPSENEGESLLNPQKLALKN